MEKSFKFNLTDVAHVILSVVYISVVLLFLVGNGGEIVQAATEYLGPVWPSICFFGAVMLIVYPFSAVEQRKQHLRLSVGEYALIVLGIALLVSLILGGVTWLLYRFSVIEVATGHFFSAFVKLIAILWLATLLRLPKKFDWVESVVNDERKLLIARVAEKVGCRSGQMAECFELAAAKDYELLRDQLGKSSEWADTEEAISAMLLSRYARVQRRFYRLVMAALVIAFAIGAAFLIPAVFEKLGIVNGANQFDQFVIMGMCFVALLVEPMNYLYCLFFRHEEKQADLFVASHGGRLGLIEYLRDVTPIAEKPRGLFDHLRAMSELRAKRIVRLEAL